MENDQLVPIPPVASLFSSIKATFYVIKKHWKVMLKRSGKPVVIICSLVLGLWLLLLTFISILELPPKQRFEYQILATVLVVTVGVQILGLLSLYLFLINATFASKIVLGATVSYEKIFWQVKGIMNRKKGHVLALACYGSSILLLGTITLFGWYEAITRFKDAVFMVILLVFLTLIVLYLLASYPLAFPLLGNNPNIRIRAMFTRSSDLAKNKTLKILVLLFLLILIIGFLSILVLALVGSGTLVMAMGSISILRQLLLSLHVNFLILDFLMTVFWIGIFVSTSVAFEILLVTSILGSFYGTLYGTLVLMNQCRPFPWQQT